MGKKSTKIGQGKNPKKKKTPLKKPYDNITIYQFLCSPQVLASPKNMHDSFVEKCLNLQQKIVYCSRLTYLRDMNTI